MMTTQLWVCWLTWAEYRNSTSFDFSIYMTPLEVVYGRVPPPILFYEYDISVVDEVDRQLGAGD